MASELNLLRSTTITVEATTPFNTRDWKLEINEANFLTEERTEKTEFENCLKGFQYS